MRTEQVRTEHGISQIMCENNSWREKKITTENLIIPPFPKILIQHAFETIDTDQSGTVDNKELYAGPLLFLHLKLATYLGSAACRPAPREYAEEIFQLLVLKDMGDQSGTLDW